MALIFGTLGGDELDGTEDGDVIYGGPITSEYVPESPVKGDAANDTIYGHGGNDTLFGQGGNDLLDGGAGDDSLVGGFYASFADTLMGGAGNDTLEGSFSDVILEGGEGDDRLIGGIATYTFATSGVTVDSSLTGPQQTGGAGVDTLVSISDIYGSAFNDILTGRRLRGAAGDDTLTAGSTAEGGDGNDTITGRFSQARGGDGDDSIQSSPTSSPDLLDGGNGNDTLVGSANLREQQAPTASRALKTLSAEVLTTCCAAAV